MFKNYLTYSMALSFHRSCLTLGNITPQVKERLMRSSETMIEHFTRSVHAKVDDHREQATHLYVALICLRDCKEILVEQVGPVASASGQAKELLYQWEVVHGRVEKLCLDAADKSGGQIRMLG